MFLDRLISPNAAKAAGRKLYAGCAAQARTPDLYLKGGAPDTVEGRFELYSLHVALMLLRLKGEGRVAGEVSQVLFDAYVRSLDDALREMGVSDLAVGRKMRKLGEAFYGRAKSWEAVLEALPDTAPLEELLKRTVLEGLIDPDAAYLRDYAVACDASLRGQATKALTSGIANWPAPQ